MEFSGSADAAIKKLRKLNFVKTASKMENHLVVVAEAGISRLGDIIETATKAGAKVGRIRHQENTLEDVFIHLTGRRLR